MVMVLPRSTLTTERGEDRKVNERRYWGYGKKMQMLDDQTARQKGKKILKP